MIKSWFRYLSPKLLDGLTPDSLITDEDRIQEDINALMEPQYSIFVWLLDRMRQIAEYHEHNGLTIKSFSVMLAPTLYTDIESCLVVIAFLQHSSTWRKRSLHQSSQMIRKSLRISADVDDGDYDLSDSGSSDS